MTVTADAFAVVADYTRRQILHELVAGERAVGDLAGTLGLSQPAVSKHLKVLRDNRFVISQARAQQRIYRLNDQRDGGPFEELAAWLEPFRQLWNHHLDALDRHLDLESNQSGEQS